MPKNNHTVQNRLLSVFLILSASVLIFAIAQVIHQFLINNELAKMYISFCAGFILFTPLVSLTLHPLLLSNSQGSNKIKRKGLLVNVGLVAVVQGLFFLIWMTDAIAIYSMYVDANSFLAKAFNINSESVANSSQSFYWLNLLLAWLFAFLSLMLGLIPCLIARVKNFGVVGNFVSAFKFVKLHKLSLVLYALCLALAVVMPLMYSKYLFIIVFPLMLIWVFIGIARRYLQYQNKV